MLHQGAPRSDEFLVLARHFSNCPRYCRLHIALATRPDRLTSDACDLLSKRIGEAIYTRSPHDDAALKAVLDEVMTHFVDERAAAAKAVASLPIYTFVKARLRNLVLYDNIPAALVAGMNRSDPDETYALAAT